MGGGLGFLTELLADRPGLFVFEVDRRLAARLAARHPGLEVRGDAREWDPAAEGPDGLLAANLPYALSGEALAWLAENPSRFAGAVLLLQREVAERVVAEVGTRKYGLLSGPIRAAYEARVRLRVPPGSFLPPPKVESAVLTLDRLPSPPSDSLSRAHLRVAKAAFSQRRKRARPLLAGLLDEEAVSWIPEGARAEDIGPDLGQRLAARLEGVQR